MASPHCSVDSSQTSKSLGKGNRGWESEVHTAAARKHEECSWGTREGTGHAEWEAMLSTHL